MTSSRKRRVLFDIGVLLGIPVILLIIHFVVSEPTASNYYFYPLYSSILNAFTAAFLHDSWKHVGLNSAAYALTVLTTYMIYWKWERKRTMWPAFLAILVTTPLVTGLGNILAFQFVAESAPEGLNIKGFSAISSAFLGMLWATIESYTNHETDSNTGYWIVFVAYLIAAIYLLFLYQPSTLTDPLFLVLVSVGFAVALHGINKTLPLERIPDPNYLKNLTSEDTSILIVGSWFIGIILFTGYFPASITSNGSTTNILSHLIGLVYGYAVAFVIIRVYGTNYLRNT